MSVRMQVQSLASFSELRIWYCRPAAAAPIQPLAMERAYAVGVTVKKKRRRRRRGKKRKRRRRIRRKIRK